MKKPLWSPSRQTIETAASTLFAHQNGLVDTSYQALHRWSIQQPAQFWSALWDYCAIRGFKGEDIFVAGKEFYQTQWFPQARLNYADNLLYLPRTAAEPAILFVGEDGTHYEWSRLQVRQEVLKCASSLHKCGIRKGDVVAGYLPNDPYTIICMLACSWLGIIWSSCSPDFGVQGVIDRLGQIQPQLLFTTRSYIYKGKHYDMTECIGQITAHLPRLRHTVYIPNRDKQSQDGLSWRDFIQQGTKTEPPCEMLPFHHPLVIMFSSGTTGKPKCIVHSQGGVLLKHLSEHKLNLNLNAADNLFYFTTCGWMMWNWMVSGLLAGARLTLYDGNPFYPSASRLIELWQEEQVTVAGVSAKLLETMAKERVSTQGEGLTSVRMICSTGSPLSVHGFDYVYQQLSAKLCLASISGGTDLLGCLVMGTPTLPVYRGEIQAATLGMDVAIFNEEGQTIEAAKGELICRTPFPTVPLYFWGDDARQSKLHNAYFAKFPGVWAQNDYAEKTTAGGYIIYGRSDTTLNPSGVRIGTAEIYRVLEPLDEITESLVVEQNWETNTRMILFVVLKPGLDLDESLKNKIRRNLRHNLSPRHIPSRIIAVTDLPRTVSGKISELAVKNCINDNPLSNTAALVNPDSLQQFLNLTELQS